MAILKRKSGHYTVVIDPPREHGRRGRRITIGTYARKRDAEAAEREAMQAREKGTLIRSRLTVDELFERFMADAKGRNLSGMTLGEYRGKWGLYVSPRIGSVPVDKLRPIDLADLYAAIRKEGGLTGRPLGVRTVQHVATLIKGVLGWAYRLEVIPRNVADFVEAPKGSRRKAVPYQQHEAEAMIATAMRGRVGPLVVFAFHTGLRRGELCGLKWTDIDETRRVAVIRHSIGQVTKKRAKELGQEHTWAKSTKGDSEKPISLSDVALEALRLRRVIEREEKRAFGATYKDEGYVFAPPSGGYTTPGGLANSVRRVAVRAGVATTSIHAARHSTASFLLSDGVPIATVSELLRHASKLTTTGTYSHVLDGAQTEAVEHLSRRLPIPVGNHRETAEGSGIKKAV